MLITRTSKIVSDGKVISLGDVEVQDPRLTLSTNEVKVFKDKPKTVELSYLGEGTVTITNPSPTALSATYDSVTKTITLVNNQSDGSSDVNLTVSLNRSDSSVTESVTLTVHCYLVKSMNDYSWSEISSIIKAGKFSDHFKVGDTKDITLNLSAGTYFTNAVSGTYKIVVLGINHNPSKEGTNRVHFCIGQDSTGKEICFDGRSMNSTNTNSGGWNGCEMKTFLNGTFYNALPNDLKNVITECTKYTDNTGGSSNTAANVTSTSQKIWLLAEFEVFGTRNGANQYEQNSQAQYDYYKNGNSKVRYQHASQDSAGHWWLRSPYYIGSNSFRIVNTGGYSSNSSASYALGVVPGFTIS